MSRSSNRLLAPALIALLLVAVAFAAVLAASPQARSDGSVRSFDAGTGTPLVTFGRTTGSHDLPVTATASSLRVDVEQSVASAPDGTCAASVARPRIIRPLRI